MNTENWIALGMLGLSSAGMFGGLILYAMKLIREVGEIAANTRNTADRLNTVASDGQYIRIKVDDHAEKLGELSQRTQRLESSVASMHRPAKQGNHD